MRTLAMDNRSIAQHLIGLAHALEAEGGSLYRVRAYRRAAETILGLDRPLAEIVAESGVAGLRRLPGIGSHLSARLMDLVGDEALQV
jgi:DNA polymerase (family 10)